MATTSTDRRQGVLSSAAVKVPCRVATTANITLSGEQTIDGVAVVTDDRVLVKDQTDGTENGIYDANTSAWTRAKDWDGAYDVQTGTLTRVNSGTNSGWWYVSTTGDITVGTTSVTIALADTSLVTFSAFGQTLVDDADAATARATLDAAGISANETISGNKTHTGTITMSGKSIWTAQGASVASASSTNIWATDGNTVHVTGSVDIDDFGTAPQAGAWKRVILDGTPLLKHSSNLSLPGLANFQSALNGDSFIVYANTTTQFDIVDYQRKDGSPINMILPGSQIEGLSATTASFLSISPRASQIYLLLEDVSTNGTSVPILRLGDSGGFETTGYSSVAQDGVTAVTSTVGFALSGAHAAADDMTGIITISKMISTYNVWVVSGVIGHPATGTASYIGGVKTLSGTLDRMQLTMTNGTDAFDGGNVHYKFL